MKNRRFLPMVLVTIAAIALTWTAPAAAGTWSGSTPDNGMGQSVTSNGSSSEKQDPADPTGCTIIYNSTTTTVVTDNRTGKVVSTTTRNRMRKYKIKNCPAKVKVVPRPAKNDVLIVPVVPGAKADINVIGSSTDTTTVTTYPNGSKNTQQTSESSGAGGYTRTDSSTTTDGTGKIIGGNKRTVHRQGTKRTTTGQDWSASGWVDIPTQTVPLHLQASTLLMPDSASRGGYASGVVLVTFTTPDGSSGQTVANGNVTVTEPHGQHFSLQTPGEIVLAAGDLMPGKMYLSFGNPFRREIRIIDQPPATQPSVVPWDNPPIVTSGNALTVSGSGLATGDGPLVLACTGDGCQAATITAASDRQLIVTLPKLPPGPCSLIVENGSGKFSKPVTINPVDVALILPPSGTAGQTLDAVVQLTGLMPQNLNRTLQATVNLLGPGIFENGGVTEVVNIVHGMAHVKITARAAGTLNINVRNVH